MRMVSPRPGSKSKFSSGMATYMAYSIVLVEIAGGIALAFGVARPESAILISYSVYI